MSNNHSSNWYKYELQCIKEHQRIYPEKSIYHWTEIPEKLLVMSGWIDDLSFCAKMRSNRSKFVNSYCEYGLDGIAVGPDGRYDFLQMKYWHNSCLTANNLGTFLLCLTYSIGNDNDTKGYIYHHGTDISLKMMQRLPNRIVSYRNLMFEDTTDKSKGVNGVNGVNGVGGITRSISEESEDNEYKNSIYEVVAEEIFIEMPKKIKVDDLRPHQRTAFDEMLDTSFRQMLTLVMSPASGKTLLTGVFLEETRERFVVVMNVLIEHTQQNYERLSPYFSRSVNINSSDGRNLEEVQAIIDELDEDETLMISVTYKSLDIIKQLVFPEEEFYVIDEAHCMTDDLQEYLLDEDNPKQGYCMTGTCTNDLSNYFPVFYSLTLSEAIKEGIVCDYEIYIPSFKNSEDVRDTLSNRTDFLTTGMLREHCRFTVAYLSSKIECTKFRDSLLERARTIYSVEMRVDIITDKTSKKDRAKILNRFRTGYQNNRLILNVILSVQILNQAVDIPLCDSVYFGSISNNQSLTVQRICRGNRKNSDQENKITKVFYFCDGDEGIDKLLGLKNYEDFSGKIRMMRIGYSNTNKEIIIGEILESSDQQRRIFDIIKVDDISPTQSKFEMWLREVIERGDLVKKSDIITDFKIGSFQHNLLGALSGGNKCYRDNLSGWIEKIKINRHIWDLIEERVNKNKESLSIEEKFKLWSETVIKNNKLVKQSDIIKGFKIGSFQHNLLGALSGGNKCYRDNLSGWIEKIKINRHIWDLIEERVNKNKEKRLEESLSIEEKFEIWLETVIKNNNLVKRSDTIKGFKIGIFQNDLLGALSGRNNHYKNNLSGWIEKIKSNEHIWDLIEERVNKNKEKRLNE